MEKTISVNCECDMVSSVDYIIDSDTKREIIQAIEIMKNNLFIKNIRIDGHKLWQNLKQFDKQIDEDDRKEIPLGDVFEFRSDVQFIEVSKGGYAQFQAQNKWNSNELLTFEIE